MFRFLSFFFFSVRFFFFFFKSNNCQLKLLLPVSLLRRICRWSFWKAEDHAGAGRSLPRAPVDTDLLQNSQSTGAHGETPSAPCRINSAFRTLKEFSFITVLI